MKLKLNIVKAWREARELKEWERVLINEGWGYFLASRDCRRMGLEVPPEWRTRQDEIAAELEALRGAK